MGEANFIVGTSQDTDTGSDCLNSIGDFEQVPGKEIVNAIPFYKGSFSQAGAGNIWEEAIYRALHENTCYEIAHPIHYGALEKHDPGLDISEFNSEGVLQNL